MGNDYLTAFVIGSSCLVFLLFFGAVSQFDKSFFNYDYVSYTFLAPVALGLMNVVSLWFAKRYRLSPSERFLSTSMLAPTLVLITVAMFDIYNYTTADWIHHILKVYLVYFVVWNVIVYNLDKYV